MHLCNAYTLALADKDPGFKALLRQASINFPDGKSVVWANKLLHRGQQIPNDRVYGPDLFLDVFELGEAVGLRHYVLGSTPDVLAKTCTELRRRFPEADIVGEESPPFRDLTDAETREQRLRIVHSRAQIVWVGLGTPKQDWESAHMADHIPVVFAAVGAAFDFVAGNVRQAPLWMQRRGFEWLYRFAIEPRRLWRRYLFGNARFIRAAMRRPPRA